MQPESKVFMFRLSVNGYAIGTYGAFDDSETAAKIRLEEFFKGFGRKSEVVATLIDILKPEAVNGESAFVHVPVLDRRVKDEGSWPNDERRHD